MRLRPKYAWFLAFTAIYAVGAAFVFWGTWSLDFAPVMPDSPIVYSPYWFSEWLRQWADNGKFLPSDVYKLVGSPYFWQEFNYAIGPYFAALATAYFLRGRKLSRLASYGGALLLAFSGYWFTLFSAGHGSWFIWMIYGLFPFGLIDRALEKGKLKNWLLLGASLGWASYWQTDLWLLFSVFEASYFIFRLIEHKKIPFKGMLIALVALFIVGSSGFYNAIFKDLAGRDAQISQGQTLTNVNDKTNDEKRWIFVTNWSLPPEEAIEFFIPRINGDTSCLVTLLSGSYYQTGVKPYTGSLGRPYGAKEGNYRQHSLYVGLVTCVLALIGIIFGLIRKDKFVMFFFVSAIVFCLLSFGRYFELLYRCVYLLPFGDYLRAPVKWHHLTEFSICVLAAFGVDFLVNTFNTKANFLKFIPHLVLILLIVGVVDLVRRDAVYCAPIYVGQARRQGAMMDMTIINPSELMNPNVRAMVQSKRLVLLSNTRNGQPVLVGVIKKAQENKSPITLSLPAYLNILSFLCGIFILVYAIFNGKGKRV